MLIPEVVPMTAVSELLSITGSETPIVNNPRLSAFSNLDLIG